MSYDAWKTTDPSDRAHRRRPGRLNGPGCVWCGASEAVTGPYCSRECAYQDGLNDAEVAALEREDENEMVRGGSPVEPGDGQSPRTGLGCAAASIPLAPATLSRWCAHCDEEIIGSSGVVDGRRMHDGCAREEARDREETTP